MVPASSTWTCWKRRSENSGAKGAKSRITVVGRVRIFVHLFRRIGDERTLPFPPTNGQSPAKLHQEKENTIANKGRVSPEWFTHRMKLLDGYQNVLKATISIGKQLGDAFAWLF